MTENLHMTVLIDNIAAEPLKCEWGLSILINADEKAILLDAGASGLFGENAALLGLDLGEVDAAVLSHAHYDHSDGMETFFSLNDHAPFFIREGSRENCFGTKEGKLRYIGIARGVMEKFADRIEYAGGVHELWEGIWLLPHLKGDYANIALHGGLYTMEDDKALPDDFAHEQSLVIETKKGLVVFNSCSHTGMDNILNDVKQLLGREDVYAFVGGLHLYKHSEAELQELCDELEKTAVEKIYTGHCTGDEAFKVLKSRLGDRIEQISSGFMAEL